MLKNTIHIGTSAISVMFFGRQKNCRKKEEKYTPCNRYATLNTLVLLTLSFSLEKHIFFIRFHYNRFYLVTVILSVVKESYPELDERGEVE